MKCSHLLALTTAALLATGSAFAGPDCKKPCPKDGRTVSADQDSYEVVERDGDGEAREGKKQERGEKGERGDKKKGDHKRHSPLHGLELSDDQKESAKEIFSAAREQSKELMESIKAKKEAGEEIDRESVREQMMAIRKGAMDNVYENVLNDDQRAKVDERRKKMEERRAEREKNGEGKDGERPERKRKGKGGDKDKGDDGLDL